VVTELKILRWCDACRVGDEYMPAEEVLVRLGDSARALDLCESHYQEYVEPLARLVQEAGHDPDQVPPPRGSKVPSKGAVAPRERDSFDRCTCLVCGMETKAMSQHIKSQHHLNMQAVYGTTCPLCGGEAKSISGVGTHLTKTHRIHGVARGFALADAEGDPHGIVAGRRRVCANLTGRSEALFTESP